MSWVTTIILHMGLAVRGEYFLPQISAWFDQYHESEPGFVLVDDPQLPRRWYGRQPIPGTLAIGAFNWLDLDGLIEHLQAIEWPYPEDVQLILMDEGETRFRIINLFEEQAAQEQAPADI